MSNSYVYPEDSCSQSTVGCSLFTPYDGDQGAENEQRNYFGYFTGFANQFLINDRRADCVTSSDQLSSGAKVDPFAPQSKIPLPLPHVMSLTSTYFDTATFIRRRNERERARVRSVNEGFERLRHHLPLSRVQKEKRLSKVETLRFAITYIRHLQSVLEQPPSC